MNELFRLFRNHVVWSGIRVLLDILDSKFVLGAIWIAQIISMIMILYSAWSVNWILFATCIVSILMSILLVFFLFSDDTFLSDVDGSLEVFLVTAIWLITLGMTMALHVSGAESFIVRIVLPVAMAGTVIRVGAKFSFSNSCYAED